jgi:hypothetical protein
VLTLREFVVCDDPGVRMVTENYLAKSLAFDIRPEHQSAIVDLQDEAERHLTTFDFVGIVEHFDVSIAALSRAIGVDLEVNRLNITRARPTEPASPTDIEIIQRRNEIDYALYAKKKERFEQIVCARSGEQEKSTDRRPND